MEYASDNIVLYHYHPVLVCYIGKPGGFSDNFGVIFYERLDASELSPDSFQFEHAKELVKFAAGEDNEQIVEDLFKRIWLKNPTRRINLPRFKMEYPELFQVTRRYLAAILIGEEINPDNSNSYAGGDGIVVPVSVFEPNDDPSVVSSMGLAEALNFLN